MTAQATKADLPSIRLLRALFLQELNRQVRYDAVHSRGWSDTYLLTLDGLNVGYISTKARDDSPTRNTIFECFVLPPFRTYTDDLFRAALHASAATHIECQSNEPVLTSLLYRHATEVSADTILFEEHVQTALVAPGVTVRPRREDDKAFEHTAEPIGDYVAVLDGEIVGTAGFLCHYNPPFADLYMEVRPDRRRRGVGSLLIQEAKKACYLAGRVPAARTGVDNVASRATLERAGLRACGFMLCGRVKESAA